MTPLMPAPQTPAVPAQPCAGTGAPQPMDTGESFATALEQGLAVLAGEIEDVRLEQEPAADSFPEAESALGIGTGLPAMLQPLPPWPPAGLAGLAFSPPGDDAAAGQLPAPAGYGGQTSRGVDGGGDAGPPAGLALPGTIAETAPEAGLAPGDGGEPSPPLAFALPALASPPPVQDAPPMLEAPLPAPEVRARDFSDGFGAQLQWMANEQIGHARIRVSPQELGPVEVMLRLDGERISADFVSAHAETRQALEHGLPRLRDLLGEHGFQLAHAGVGQESPGSHDDAAPAMTGGPQPSGEGDEVKGAARRPTPLAVSTRLLDAYA